MASVLQPVKNDMFSNDICGWIQDIYEHPEFTQVLMQARVAFVNPNKYGAVGKSAFEKFKATFLDLGLGKRVAGAVAKVIWFMGQKREAGKSCAWLTEAACRLKLNLLPQWAGLFWHLKKANKFLGAYLCEFVWHRPWRAFDSATDTNLGNAVAQVKPYRAEEKLGIPMKTLVDPETMIPDGCEDELSHSPYVNALMADLSVVPSMVQAIYRSAKDYLKVDEKTYWGDWQYYISQLLTTFPGGYSEAYQESARTLIREWLKYQPPFEDIYD